jgi:hypothetical protein
MARDMRPGFHMDTKAIGRIAKTDPGIKAEIHRLAQTAAHKAGGHVEDYTTDRAVSAVVVDAADQARNGAATKAGGELGLRLH